MTIPKNFTAKQCIATIRELGLRPRCYSGRGMYGAQCVGVSVDYLGEYALPPGWQHDRLGKGFIVYWPQYTWPEDEKSEL